MRAQTYHRTRRILWAVKSWVNNWPTIQSTAWQTNYEGDFNSRLWLVWYALAARQLPACLPVSTRIFPFMFAQGHYLAVPNDSSFHGLFILADQHESILSSWFWDRTKSCVRPPLWAVLTRTLCIFRRHLVMARILKARFVTCCKRLLVSPRFLVSLQTHIAGVVNFALTATEYIWIA